MEHIRMTGGRVLGGRNSEKETSGGIVLLEEKQKPYFKALVVGKTDVVEVGDLFVVSDGSGVEVELVGGERCMIFEEYEIIAKVEV